VVFAGIALSLAVAYVVRPTGCCRCRSCPTGGRGAAGVPADLLANIAFAKRFKEAADSQAAFAINIMGRSSEAASSTPRC
jgi:hypothetical protein